MVLVHGIFALQRPRAAVFTLFHVSGVNQTQPGCRNRFSSTSSVLMDVMKRTLMGFVWLGGR